MKEQKILKLSVFIMPIVIAAMLSGCGAGRTNVSRTEDMKGENQETDLSSADGIIPSEGISEEGTGRVDNPDGGWIISEYDEEGKEVKQSCYDADGNLKQIKEYKNAGNVQKLLAETDYDITGREVQKRTYLTTGSISCITEYTYYDADGGLKQIREHKDVGVVGEQLTETDYDITGRPVQSITYNARGSITDIIEYNEAGEQIKTKSYVYNGDGSINTETEYNSESGERKKIKYEYEDGALFSETEYNGTGHAVKYNEYKDGTLFSETEYNDAGYAVKYNQYKDGALFSETEFKYNDAGYEVKYTEYKDGVLFSETEYNNAGYVVKYISYNYTYYNNDTQIVGYTVTEYDDAGKMVDTTYVELDPAAGQLIDVDLTQQKETEHFVFYCIEQDIEVLDVLVELLEENYEKVTSDLGRAPSAKTKVYISPNLKTHHKTIGRPDDPDWSVGQGGDGCLYMVSPLNPGPAHTYEEMFPIAVHEFVHVIVGQINKSVPIYLNEGIATYEAGQESGAKYYVRSDMSSGTLPSLTEMEGWKNYTKMSDASRAYAYGYVYIDFVVERFGFDTVVSQLEGKSQTEAFGMSKEELNEKWMDFLASYGE